MKLSILMCSIVGREKMLDAHRKYFAWKAKKFPIEFLCEVDNKEMAVGEKRNKLIDRAQGEYIAFIDDDDTINPDYIDLVMEALRDKPDVIGFRGKILSTIDRYDGMIFEHSIDYVGWYTGSDGVYYRTPNHLNPVKRELAAKVRFNPKISNGEDFDYSKRLRPLLYKEEFIDEILYYYNLEPTNLSLMGK